MTGNPSSQGGPPGAAGAAAFGPVGPRDLVDARLQLHHAALLVSAVGRGLAPKQRGYRQAALTWDDDRRALVGADIRTRDGARLRAELVLDPPGLSVAQGNGARAHPVWWQPLRDVNLDTAWSGLRDAADASGLAASTLALRMPEDLPDHPLRRGDPFSVDAGCGTTLADWFAYANRLLSDVARAQHGQLPVPCWGDHFDMAVSTDLAQDSSITVGFSPGDTSIAEPYFYVLPWPVPDPGRLPGAPVNAQWQTKGWVGLALNGSTIVALPDPDSAGRAFLQEGFEIAQDVLLAAP